MQIYRVVIAFVLLGFVASSTASATSPRLYNFELDQRELRSLIKIYHHTHGVYPVNDDQSTWFEKLSEHGQNVTYLRSAVSNDGMHLLGEFGFPIVFEPPSQANGNQIVIRDVGENGIDDGGLLDDWDSRFGPQTGYWYKKRWPGYYRRVVSAILVAVLGIVIIQSKIKPSFLRFAVFCFLFGFLCCIVWPWVGGRDRYGGLGIEIGIPIGLALLIIGIFFSVFHMIKITCFQGYLSENGSVPCQECGYDLRGTIAANITRCPECGESVPVDADKDVDLTSPPSP